MCVDIFKTYTHILSLSLSLLSLTHTRTHTHTHIHTYIYMDAFSKKFFFLLFSDNLVVKDGQSWCMDVFDKVKLLFS
jgi:hypothetical protein